MSNFPYKKILVLGATSGIGEGLAARFIKEGRQVIVLGRRAENLEQFVKTHGADKASSITFDITQLDKIPAFVADVTKQHPDLDCVILNSGIQRSADWSKPESIDLGVHELEFTTNYLAYLHLTKALLPFFQAKSKSTPTALAYTTSGLALIPMARCSNYCASKAALHHWILTLRLALADEYKDLRIIEILPPAVQTELHDAKHQPEIKDGRNIGMPLDEFVDETWKGLSAGKEQIPVGMAAMGYKEDGFETKRQQAFQGMAQRMKAEGMK